MKKNFKKLTLNKKSIAKLTDAQLESIQGGNKVLDSNGSNSCNSCINCDCSCKCTC